MTRDRAMTEARKRWGKQAVVQKHDRRSSPELRRQADQLFRELKAEQADVDRELRERLAECEWYQRLTTRQRELRKALQAPAWARAHKQYSVGTNEGIAFWVKGEGDTWEEAFTDASTREA